MTRESDEGRVGEEYEGRVGEERSLRGSGEFQNTNTVQSEITSKYRTRK